jgi:hypothetical protein
MRLLAAIVALTAVLALEAGPANAQESLQGAWKVVEMWGHNAREGEWRTENIQPSVFLFMERYYSIAYVSGEERRPLMPDTAFREDLTAEQAAAVWIPYVSNSGTYEATVSEITTSPMVAVWPNFMEGEFAVYTYRIDVTHTGSMAICSSCLARVMTGRGTRNYSDFAERRALRPNTIKKCGVKRA